MANTGGIALLALTAIILVTLLVRILGKAAIGDVDDAVVLPFIAFRLVHLLPVLLSLALFLGVFLTLSRLWQDEEMVIWQGSGLSPLYGLSPILRIAVPITLIIAFLSMVLVPWAAEKRYGFEHYIASRDTVSTLAPGVFMESSDGKQVFFVEGLKEPGIQVNNIFIHSSQHGRQGVIVAGEGAVRTEDNDDRFLVLLGGRRYEGVPGAADYRMMEFASYAIRLEPSAIAAAISMPRTRSTLDLLRDPTPANMAEWVWRLGFPISALLLAAFALPASHIQPRAGRSLNVIFAMLVYTVYSNLIGLSEAWVRQQKLSATSSMLLVHGTMALLLAWLLWREMAPPRRTRQ